VKRAELKQQRIERLLSTIDKLGVATIRQLQKIHDLGGYRNACRVVAELKPYLHEVRTNEKIVYLNKEGRQLIGSTKEIKKTPMMEHMLLANDVYIYFGCPVDWKTEYRFEVAEAVSGVDIVVNGITPVTKKTLVSDAVFTRQGYLHIIEIDRTRHMVDNVKKIQKYKEMLPAIRKQYSLMPKLYFFTTTEDRKKKLEAELNKRGILHEVKTFREIL
jgi:Replication-relaxation